jgi:hypothetical protein
MHSSADSVETYLKEISPRFFPVITEVRQAIRSSIQKGFVEAFRYSMICYEVPLEISGPTYNKQPLTFVALAAQKRYCSLYLMPIYSDPELKKKLEKTFDQHGLHKHMGKSCIRFTKTSDIPLKDIMNMLANISPADYLRIIERARSK